METNHVTRAEQEVDTYRRAAEDTIEQLDWCVGYLHRIRKIEIAAVVEKHRKVIRQR
jgi:hypothetical protein